MQPKSQRAFCIFMASVFLLLTTYAASAQEDPVRKKRLRSPTVVRGFIGGESHDSYVIRAPKGRLMTVQISWQPEGDNRAEFSISESSNFFEAEPVKFGTASSDGKRWSGRVPKSRDYYIYVVAHPAAHYTLRVRVK